MNKSVFSVVLASGALILNVSFVNASLLVLGSDGSLRVNVLSAETQGQLKSPRPNELQIDKIASVDGSGASLVKLGRSDNKISLDIYSGGGIRNLDVTNYKENVIEIEKRQNVDKISIAVVGDKFSLQDNGTVALTSLPISIDSSSAELSIKTDSGDERLGVFPFEVVQTALRTKFISNVDSNGVEIIDEDGKLQYKITGAKVINILNFYDYSIPVSSYISAATGEVIRIDAPGWLKIINVIFA